MTTNKMVNQLSLQERLKDMQSLLILKSIRVQHDEEPTTLSAIDHAIRLIQERHDSRKKEEADNFHRSFVREIVELVDRGEAIITNVEVSRETHVIDARSLGSARTIKIPARIDCKYTIEVAGAMRR
jgi:hypothetical protein